MSALMFRVTCPRCGAKPHKRCRTDGYAASIECVSARYAALMQTINVGVRECNCTKCLQPIQFRNRKTGELQSWSPSES